MYAALNEQGQLVYADQVVLQEAQVQNVWYCPRCQQRVKWRSSERQRAHFVHTKGRCGREAHATRTTRESVQHFTAKQFLRQQCQTLGIEACEEYYLSASRQEADVYLPSLKLVLEYQKTPISAAIVQERTKLYEAQQLQCQWLLAGNVEWEAIAWRFRQTMAAYDTQLGFYWWRYNVQQPEYVELIYAPNGRLTDSRRLIYTLEDVLQAQFSISALRHFSAKKGEIRHSISVLDVHALQQLIQALQQQPSYQSVLRGLYQYGVTLSELPCVIWQTKEKWWALKNPGWVILAYHWAFLKQHEYFTWTEWCAWVTYLLDKRLLQRVMHPLIVPALSNAQLAWQGLRYWLDKKMVKKTRDKCYKRIDML